MAGALLAVCSDFVQLHASGAVIGGKAVLALGPAGAGKSSLALCWNRAGYATLGDDVVFLGSDLKAHPFKRQFKVDPRVLAAAGVDAAQTPFWEPHSAEAWYDPASGAGWADPAPVSLVVRTRHSPNGALFVTETSRAVALNTLVHSLMDTSLGSRASFDILARVIRQARAVEVSFGSAAEAARAIASLIV
jgi:energy-coupling factor transporter ATP-binding protein EcfA2